MPTKRLQIPVTPETEKAIRDYAEVMGMTVPAACSKLLEQSAPGLVDLTKAMRKAHDSPAKALRDMAKAVHKIAEDADQISLNLAKK